MQFFLIIILTLYSTELFAAAMEAASICKSECSSKVPDYEKYMTPGICEGTGQQGVCYGNQFKAVTDFNKCIDSCNKFYVDKIQCETLNGGKWVEANDSFLPLLYQGYCKSGCPSGTKPMISAASSEPVSCECGNGNFIPLGSADKKGCLVERAASDCGTEKLEGFYPPDQVAAYQVCMNGGNLQAQIEENTKAAMSNWEQKAQNLLNAKLLEASQQTASECRAASYDFKNNCSNSTVQELPQLQESSTSKTCADLSIQISTALNSLQSELSSCSQNFQKLVSYCSTKTEVVSISVPQECVGSGEARGCYGPNTKSGSQEITENIQTRSSAQDLLNNLNQTNTQLSAQLSQQKQRADQCSKGFANDVKDDTNPSPPPLKPTIATTDPPSKGTDSDGPDDELGPGGGGGRGIGTKIIDGITSIADMIGNNPPGESGSGGGSSPQPVPAPNPSNPYGNSSGESFSATEGYSKGAPNYGGKLGVADSNFPDEAIYGQTDKRNKGFNASNPRGGGSGSPGYGAPYGGGYGSGASLPGGGSSSNSGSGGQKPARSYASMEKRNLVSGFKAVKPSDGGGVLSIKPSDYKKYGSKKLKEKLQEARHRHGKKMPLIFRNGKFVLDFLAMKESEEFKNRNKAMEKFWSGENINGDKGDLMKLANSEVNPNAGLNIFRILHLKYQKQFRNR